MPLLRTLRASQLLSLTAADLARTTGGGNAPLGGNVTQQINTNWGGTQVINPPHRPTPTTRIDYLREHPEARWGPPPYKPRPVRR